MDIKFSQAEIEIMTLLLEGDSSDLTPRETIIADTFVRHDLMGKVVRKNDSGEDRTVYYKRYPELI